MRNFGSILYICRQVRLDLDQKNSIFWEGMGQPVNVDKTPGRAAQLAYFQGKAKYILENYSYVRTSNRIKIQLNPEDIIDCNYIVFRNAAFGTHWYMGFITNTHYINDNTCEIEWKLDVIQTWAFDFELQPSYIERGHVTRDGVGQNLVQENLPIGNYVYKEDQWTFPIGASEDNAIYMARTTDWDYQPVEGQIISGIYQGCQFLALDGESAANLLIKKMTENNAGDSIVNLFMFPARLLLLVNGGARIEITVPPNYNDLNGYTPKNNKLFTYPYNFLTITDNEGNTGNLRYENFTNPIGGCKFQYSAALTASPAMSLFPVNYNGREYNVAEGISILFPLCSYNVDTFKAWLAQNHYQRTTQQNIIDRTYSRQTTLNTIGTIGGVIGNIALGNVVGAVATAGGGVLSQMNRDFSYDNEIAKINAIEDDKSTQPPQSRGTAHGDVLWSDTMKGVKIYPTTIRAENARIIDDFWTMFGYPIRQIHVPNLKARETWTYIKTKGINMNTVIENKYLVELKNYFEQGLTFWLNGDYIGEYGRSNSIIGNWTY